MAEKKKQKTKAAKQGESFDAESEVGSDEAQPQAPPWEGGAEITASQFEFAWVRRSGKDLQLLLNALREHGQVTVVPDP